MIDICLMGIKTLREISEKKRGEDMFEKLERKLVNVLLFFLFV